MKQPLEISAKEARCFMLSHLLLGGEKIEGDASVMRVFERLRFIAPLDNLMWDRSLISALFGMDYHWEVYEPPQKRKFGYYVIPILAGDELVGRVEPFLKKGDEIMRVRLWLEEGVKHRKIGSKAIRHALEEYTQFLGAKDYLLEAAAKENL